MRTDMVQSVPVLLDYKFGWRWLLPVVNGEKIACAGLNADEQRWWAQTQLSLIIDDKDEHANGWLVALDGVDPVSIADRINEAMPRWLCTWGSGASVDRFRSNLRGFALVREYALLPADHPRVVVPFSSPCSSRAGLCLHRPGQWMARLGLLVVRGLARFGHFGLLRRRVLLIASRESDSLPQGIVQSGLPVSIPGALPDFVLYLGALEDNRKTVVLPLGDAPPSVIWKVAESPKARAALQNESQALIEMGQTPLAGLVPRHIGLVETDGRLTLVQEFRKRCSVTQSRMNAAVTDFLVGMSAIGREQVTIAEWLPMPQNHTSVELTPEVRGAAAKLRSRLDVLVDNGARVWLHRSHGDLALWNCCWSDKGFFVFDWEESCARDIALGDAFYFVLSPYVHVRKKPNVSKALASALRFASEVAIQAGLNEVDIRLYLAIWSLSRLGKDQFYGELALCLEQEWP